MATQTGSIDLKGMTSAYSDQQQYFWVESNSSATWGGGAHITNIAESEFKTAAGTWDTNPIAGGYNLLMNTDTVSGTGSLQLRNGALPIMNLDNDSLDFNIMDSTTTPYSTINIATFGSSGARIGDVDGAHSVIDANGQRFYASDGTTQLANIGYGAGTDSGGGTSNAPFYTFGIRPSVGEIGNYSVAEGHYTSATGYASHAEGSGTRAIGFCSHAEGVNSKAQGTHSHAEGYGSDARDHAHAEGYVSWARGDYSHAECYSTKAMGEASHAEGGYSQADGDYSHVQNLGTIAAKQSQTSLGSFNAEDTSQTTTHPSGEASYGQYAVIVGNGTTAINRSNAVTIDWLGNVVAAGDITDGTGNVLSDKIGEDVNGDVSVTRNITVGGNVEASGYVSGKREIVYDNSSGWTPSTSTGTTVDGKIANYSLVEVHLSDGSFGVCNLSWSSGTGVILGMLSYPYNDYIYVNTINFQLTASGNDYTLIVPATIQMPANYRIGTSVLKVTTVRKLTKIVGLVATHE